jgi:general secretion pathway protein A
MYTAFFGLREKPFALSPDPRFLFLAESHREALAHLLYGIEQGEGFIAITGEVGTGKTTLCRTLLQRLGADTEVAFLFNPKLSAFELLQAIHAELGISTTTYGSRPDVSWRELSDALNRFLLDRKRDGKRVLLIVDEAQNLEPDTLEQIRLLSNLETQTSKLIQIVLLGQPELDAKLDTQALRQLRQRISVRWRLSPLGASETQEYVRHRLRIASGVDRPLFDPAALRVVHKLSGGVPRVINILCDRALLSGYAEGVKEIGPAAISRAAREMHGGEPPASARRRWGPPPWVGGSVAVAALAFAIGLGFAPAILSRAPQPESSAPDSSPAAEPRAAVQPVALGDALVATAAAASPPSVDSAPPAALVSASIAVSTPPRNLAGLLSEAGSDSATAAALDAVLVAWGEPPRVLGGIDLPEALLVLEEAGFTVLPMVDASLDVLHDLGYPTLLRFPSPDGRGPVALLVALDDGTATLEGVTPGTSVVVPRAQLEGGWDGEAFVVWREFESLPDTLSAGDSGPGVAWLQDALSELGFLSRDRTGRFDLQTTAAVLAFQQSHALEADGAVGPRTKMALYAALRRYGVPRLVASHAGGRLG